MHGDYIIYEVMLGMKFFSLKILQIYFNLKLMNIFKKIIINNNYYKKSEIIKNLSTI